MMETNGLVVVFILFITDCNVFRPIGWGQPEGDSTGQRAELRVT